MRKNILVAVALAVALNVSCSADRGFKPMFNGEDFTGFTQMGGEASFSYNEQGQIVGESDKVKMENSFLVSDQVYGDFILEFESKCDTLLNTGVQFRSLSLPEYRNGQLYGYQCDDDPVRWGGGGIYEEGARGWLVKVVDKPECMALYNRGDWNHFRIEALGNNIRIWLNGVNTANLYDDTTLEGLIGFQVHAIYNERQLGRLTKWRNVKIMTENVEKNLKKGELQPSVNRVANTLSEEEVADGWQLLFDGETFEGWRMTSKDEFPTKGWRIEDGAVSTTKGVYGGDLMTQKKYSAFELAFEYKITPGANSGVKYFVAQHVVNEKRKPYYGLEYQVLDDKLHPDATLYTTYPGSRSNAGLYDLIAGTFKRPAPIGLWNHAVIKARPDNVVEHWLNGHKVLEYDRMSDEFKELLKGSKYAGEDYNQEQSKFGLAESGHILLQDHRDEVSFRSIKLKELK